jgi:hypothetical protein
MTCPTRACRAPRQLSMVSTHDFRLHVSRQCQMEPIGGSSRMAAENARLTTDMDAERTKVAALQAEGRTAHTHVGAALTQEISHRRELIPKTDELEALCKWHARELLEFEAEARRRERELHDVKCRSHYHARGSRMGAKDCHVAQRGTHSARSSAELGAAGTACYSKDFSSGVVPQRIRKC